MGEVRESPTPEKFGEFFEKGGRGKEGKDEKWKKEGKEEERGEKGKREEKRRKERWKKERERKGKGEEERKEEGRKDGKGKGKGRGERKYFERGREKLERRKVEGKKRREEEGKRKEMGRREGYLLQVRNKGEKRTISSGKTKRWKLKDLNREKRKVFKIRIISYIFIAYNLKIYILEALFRGSKCLKTVSFRGLRPLNPRQKRFPLTPPGALRWVPGPHPLKRFSRFACYALLLPTRSPTFDCTPCYAAPVHTAP